jgi:HAD superfamily hydrolase (TIGR01509 family)
LTRVRAGDRHFDVDLLVLDKDGTLLDFDRMWAGRAEAAVQALLTHLQRPADDPLAALLYRTLGYQPETARALADSPLATAPLGVLAIAVAATLYHAQIAGWHEAESLGRDPFLAELQAPVQAAHIVPIGDLAAFVAKAQTAGLRLAIATSDSRAGTERSLSLLGVEGHFEALVCGDDPLPAKPDAEVLHHLSRRLGVAAERMLMVGDSVHDLATGRAAGAAGCIGVLSGTADLAALAAAADVVLESIHDLEID